jgi:predicted aldo/keto reductase-like oxidoreductase
MKRRDFLKGTVASAGLTVGASALGQGSQAFMHTRADSLANTEPGDLLTVTDPGKRHGNMLYRQLGSTGERVSLIGLGGAHIGSKTLTDSESIRLQHEAIDRGINFLDNSWDYNGGRSERLMGKALSQDGYRKKAFLMTKIDGRTKKAAADQLETSMKRLKTDHIDLVQHHEILRYEDPNRIFAKEGAMQALVEAKKAGKIRYIGFTGHKDPRIHLYMLHVAAEHGFRFDTVQMPLNVFDAHYRSFAHMVLPKLVDQRIGILGMKSMGSGVFLKSDAPISPIDYLHYAMTLPTSVVISGIDGQKILDQAFKAVQSFHPMSRRELIALLDKTKKYAKQGRFELFKTTTHFDGTAHNPSWLGGSLPRVEKLTG